MMLLGFIDFISVVSKSKSLSASKSKSEIDTLDFDSDPDTDLEYEKNSCYIRRSKRAKQPEDVGTVSLLRSLNIAVSLITKVPLLRS